MSRGTIAICHVLSTVGMVSTGLLELGTIRTAIVLAGLIVLIGYVLLAHGRSLLVLAVLVGIGIAFFGQRAAFSSVVVPSLRPILSTSGLESVTQAQNGFEIGFVIRTAIIGAELAIERFLNPGGKLRTFDDVVQEVFDVALILGVIVALPVVATVSDAVLSILSAILAIRIVKIGVDFALALGQQTTV